MKKDQTLYRRLQCLSSLTMLLVLLWLTVSAPFVNAAQMGLDNLGGSLEMVDASEAEDPGSGNFNPFGNGTEEKAPNGSTGMGEEYLHHSEELLYAANLSLQHFRALAAREYTAFHGELLCPPPNTIA